LKRRKTFYINSKVAAVQVWICKQAFRKPHEISIPGDQGNQQFENKVQQLIINIIRARPEAFDLVSQTGSHYFHSHG